MDSFDAVFLGILVALGMEVLLCYQGWIDALYTAMESLAANIYKGKTTEKRVCVCMCVDKIAMVRLKSSKHIL